MSQLAYSKLHGIIYQTFYKWVHRSSQQNKLPIKQLTDKNKTIAEDAKTAYLRVYCTSDIDSQGLPIILFDYQPGRHSEHAKQFLDNFSGHLMVGDYAVYNIDMKERENGSNTICLTIQKQCS